MMPVSIFGKIVAGFTGAMALVIAIAILDLQSTDRIIRNYEDVAHSQKIIRQLELVVSLLKDGETGQRGYIITQERTFLEPYNAAVTNIPHEMQTLRALLAERGGQQNTYDSLQTLVNAKISFMNRTVEMVSTGKTETTVTLIREATGKRIMDDIRRLVQRMQNQETKVLDNFSVQTADSYRRNQTIIYVGVGITALIMALGTWRLYQQLRAQDQLRDTLRNTNYQLEATVTELNTVNEELHAANEELNAANEELNTANELVSVHANQLEQVNHELAQANRELEAFSYSISHDLRSPMRSIIGYTEILNEEYDTRLDEEGKRLMSKIVVNTHRMNQLLDGLLEFSRSGRKGLAKVKFQMAQLLQPVIEEYTGLYQQNSVRVQVHSLPVVCADPELIKQVWINLVSNAFKFTSKVAQPAVEIGCRENDTEYVFHVKDNGAGFDMQYAGKKLFGVFQRMHTKEEFEGNGVGLAIAYRIIASHNGRMWAESAPDRGATFYFSLPKNA